MLDNTDPVEVGWYDWDYRLAAVAGNHAFVLSEKRGWVRVNPVDVTWDGRRFADAKAAIEAYLLKWDGIDSTVVAIHVARGIAPPKPRLFLRFILVNDAVTFDEDYQLGGSIVAEFDDGWMRKLSAKETIALRNQRAFLADFRSAKTGYWRLFL